MSVYLHLADGFEEIEALAVVDILRRAQIDVKTVSITDKLSVTGAHGITVLADQLFADADYSRADMLILPGGSQGTAALGAHFGLAEQLKAFYEAKKWIAAICAAPTVLGKLGFLKGRDAVCFPGCESDMGGAHTARPERTVVDGHIVTSRSAGTSFDFALTLVAILRGEKAAAQLKESMLIS